MAKAPDSISLCVAIFGRTNAGKSTLMNLIAGQQRSITSPVPGTTADSVTKAMELRPIGPVLFIDTAGLDDTGVLGAERIAAARKIYDRADVIILAVKSNQLGEAEEEIISAASERKIKTVPVITHADIEAPQRGFSAMLQDKTGTKPIVSDGNRDRLLTALSGALLAAAPDDVFMPPPLLGDLVKPGDTVVLIVPIDKQAPAGRLIMPQVQTIRDAIDHGAIPVICRDSEYLETLNKLKNPPALVICDSQVADFMVKNTPEEILCTTFSILFSRLKGDIKAYAAGAEAIGSLKPGDRVLIAEGCTHHAADDDIGRVKIPRLLEKMAGGKLNVTVSSGHDFPADLSEYKLAVHCGGCMLNRRETLRRISLAVAAGVPITNYGMAISFCRKVFNRVMKPFD